jgi:secretion/DNA translocation related TadE-like protein
VSGRERGGVSIVMLAVLVAGLLLTTGAARLGGALIGRARAESAADASALAAADRLALGSGAAAARSAAARTAASNHARLVSCECAGASAAVVVEVDLPPPLAVFGPARGRAKAEVRPECVVDADGC